MHRIKHVKAGTWDKGIEVKDSKPTAKENFEDAKQSYHAYLGAYAYGHNADTDYVACSITDATGAVVLSEEPWYAEDEPEPEEE